ncbi:hypothetical protein ACFPRL_23210 [Pseudoclavibacter helvolus]
MLLPGDLLERARAEQMPQHHPFAVRELHIGQSSEHARIRTSTPLQRELVEVDTAPLEQRSERVIIEAGQHRERTLLCNDHGKRAEQLRRLVHVPRVQKSGDRCGHHFGTPPKTLGPRQALRRIRDHLCVVPRVRHHPHAEDSSRLRRRMRVHLFQGSDHLRGTLDIVHRKENGRGRVMQRPRVQAARGEIRPPRLNRSAITDELCVRVTEEHLGS